jgi:precorrin-6A/cobalt-precorrin-6A reductase
VLILGGTAEGRELAARLHADGIPVISSLAGRVARPRLPPGEVRIGGFGGPDGLAAWLTEHDIGAVVDATHPFAARIGHAAADAAARSAVPLLRLERPGWAARPGDRWHAVADVAEAAATVSTLGRRALLALGRQEVAAFAHDGETWFLVRSIGAPEPPLPPRHELLLDRGPFTLGDERDLLDAHAIDVVVTRDSGGDQTSAKLTAARERAIPVVLVRRPPRPQVATVATVADAAAWCRITSPPQPSKESTAMAKVVYTAEATVTGGRQEGHGRTSDGELDVQLRPPGDGGGTNPEQLFAVGYAACFEGALGAVARRERLEVGDATIASKVALLTGEDRTYSIAVELDVTLPQVRDADEAVKLVAAAHEVCPYSNATRGNIDVTLTANGQPVG